MAGIFYSSSITFGTTTLNNSGTSFYCDLFLVKYNSSGVAQWVKNAGIGSNNDIAYSAFASTAGDIVLTGIFGNSIDFGSGPITGGGLFVTEYDAAGNNQWAKSVTGVFGSGITYDLSGNIFVTGSIYAGTATFGTTTLTNAGIYDMYLAKLNPLTSVHGPGQYLSEITIYPNPSCGIFIVRVSGNDGEINIQNILGETIHSQKINSETNKISLPSLSKGIYFVRLVMEQGVVSKKIIVE